MRKIKSKEDIEKRQRVNHIVIGVLLMFIMLSSTIGFALFSGGGSIGNSNNLEYNGIDFMTNEQGLWKFEIEDDTFQTSFHPLDTQDIVLGFDFNVNEISGKPLYYVKDSENAVSELLYNIGRYAQRYQEVCLEGEKCEKDLIEKSCADSIIVFKSVENQPIKIYKDNKCVFIEAPTAEQVKAADRLIFKSLNIQE